MDTTYVSDAIRILSCLPGSTRSAESTMTVSDVKIFRNDASARSVLEQMAECVQRGEFEDAVNCGNSFRIPLAVTVLPAGREVGKGTESVIRCGNMDGEEVAVKKSIIRVADDLARFRNEVGILCSFSDPYIVSLLGARALPPSYSMTFLYEKGWRATWAEILHISIAMAHAVATVHSKGLVHRDIKPGNILIGNGRPCVLSDFGLAREVDKLPSTTTSTAPSGGFHKQRIVGTLQYLPPEVLMGNFHQQASDVYALAVTLNEIATATRPYSDCTKDNPACHTVLDANYSDMDLRTAVASEHLRPMLPSTAPSSWSHIMQSCWHVNPADRPTADLLLQALNKLCERDHIQPAASLQFSDTVLARCKTDPCPAPLPFVELDKSRLQICSTEHPEWVKEIITSSKARSIRPAMICGSYADPGLRGTACMEDRHIVAAPMQELDQVTLVAVFDGHRGASAADSAAQLLPGFLRDVFSNSKSPGCALSSAMAQCEQHILDEGVRQWAEHTSRMGSNPGRRSWPGCTALAMINVGDVLMFANVGDCRAVICRGGNAVQVTRDHVVSDTREKSWLLSSGALLRQGPDEVWRVGEAQLQVSRSLGDGDEKHSAGLRSDAETHCVQVHDNDEFVVLASDGLWDVVSNDDAVALVHDTVKNPSMAAKRLANEALMRGSTDNITVIVCFLKDGTLESIYANGSQKYSPARTFYGSRSQLLETLSKGRALDEIAEQIR